MRKFLGFRLSRRILLFLIKIHLCRLLIGGKFGFECIWPNHNFSLRNWNTFSIDFQFCSANILLFGK